jgi:pre-mRNA-splicing factor SYF2
MLLSKVCPSLFQQYSGGADGGGADYTQTARKIYKKQIRELKPDTESYAADKAKLVRDGTIVETEDGELIAIDRDGEFYADADSLGFIDNKPSKQAVDRLVGDLRKAEDARMARRKGGDEEDVTYINDKNKQFNQKLARYYNKVSFVVLSWVVG